MSDDRTLPTALADRTSRTLLNLQSEIFVSRNAEGTTEYLAQVFQSQSVDDLALQDFASTLSDPIGFVRDRLSKLAMVDHDHYSE